MNETNALQIKINVQVNYLENQSTPENREYAFAYTITMRNESVVAARLLNRHWIITDGNGEQREVRGPGVVGEHPFLRPGEAFRYTSGAVIATQIGSMRGSYEFMREDGEVAQVAIPMFTLAVPNALH